MQLGKCIELHVKNDQNVLLCWIANEFKESTILQKVQTFSADFCSKERNVKDNERNLAFNGLFIISCC